VFRDWQKSCGLRTEVWAIASPGREMRWGEKPIDDMTVLVDRLVDALPLDKPFAFFGHSLGALVSFEAARRLSAKGAPIPQRLFVSGCPAPHVSRRTDSRGRISDKEMRRELLSMGGTPSEILDNPDILAAFMPVLLADFKLADEYVPPKGYTRFPITAYGGAADAEVPLGKLRAWEHWVREFEGDHFYLIGHRQPLVEDLLRRWPWIAPSPAAQDRLAISLTTMES
jgi:medium-chain acyl-[acyl-carrier-protein] hydrolase